jgi:hypothetical protein
VCAACAGACCIKPHGRCVRAKHITAPRSCGYVPGHGNARQPASMLLVFCCAVHKHTIRRKKKSQASTLYPKCSSCKQHQTHTHRQPPLDTPLQNPTPPVHALHRHTPMLPACPQPCRPHYSIVRIEARCMGGDGSRPAAPLPTVLRQHAVPRHAPPKALTPGKDGTHAHNSDDNADNQTFCVNWHFVQHLHTLRVGTHNTHTDAVRNYPQQEQGSGIQQHQPYGRHTHTRQHHTLLPCVTQTHTRDNTRARERHRQ